MKCILVARKLIQLGKINMDSMNTQVVKTANQPPSQQ